MIVMSPVDTIPPPRSATSNLSLVQALNAVIADLFAVYLKTKNFHWHVCGPHFREYHLLLDEQAAEILAATDPLAERVRKQGCRTLTSIGQIGRLQQIRDNDREAVSAVEMLEELRQDNQTLVLGFREIKALAEEAGDNATSGLVDQLTDEAERRVWFLRQTLGGS